MADDMATETGMAGTEVCEAAEIFKDEAFEEPATRAEAPAVLLIGHTVVEMVMTWVWT